MHRLTKSSIIKKGILGPGSKANEVIVMQKNGVIKAMRLKKRKVRVRNG